MPEDFDHPELANLPADVRGRVQEALKATLAKEIAASATAVNPAGGLRAAHSRSQGAFFSRSKTSDVLRHDDDLVVQQVSKLDDASFEKFAGRLAKLKNLNRPG